MFRRRRWCFLRFPFRFSDEHEKCMKFPSRQVEVLFNDYFSADRLKSLYSLSLYFMMRFVVWLLNGLNHLEVNYFATPIRISPFYFRLSSKNFMNFKCVDNKILRRVVRDKFCYFQMETHNYNLITAV